VSFAAAEEVLREAIASRAFPAAVAEVGTRDAVFWRRAFGRLTYDPASPETTAETIFDLASLTKVMATATLVMRAVDDGRLRLEDPVAQWIREWRGADREHVTIRDLLEHSSGLTAYLPFFRDHTGRAEFQPAIATMPLEYEPRTQSIYSDLGFMLLAFILDDARAAAPGLKTRPTDVAVARGAFNPADSFTSQFRRIASLVTDQPLCFSPSRELRDRIAPTEHDAWRGRTLVGEVHDENTWALGGAAGHAGLFGTTGAVGGFARAVLHTLLDQPLLARTETMQRFAQRGTVPGSSRALGWDTMLPTSSCGTLMSPTAIGHTGFTGTSLWIDWERDLYVVLLTNRVHPTRENNAIKAVRPRFHDAVLREHVRT
jgi:CubicO group peptidase (beta-lactamase class C family)